MWPLSSWTRQVPFGAGSKTLPSTLISSLFSVKVRFVLLVACYPGQFACQFFTSDKGRRANAKNGSTKR
jgi:hypothetical protein